jgi:multisubunit Na+/H+ antiporter MnhE subunit
MEHLALWIYLFGIVDNMQAASTVIACVGAAVTGFGLIISIMAADAASKTFKEFYGGYKKVFRILYIIIGLSTLIATLTPSKETIATMVIIPKIAANKDVQQLPANVAKMLNNAVISWGEQLSPDKKGKK